MSKFTNDNHMCYISVYPTLPMPNQLTSIPIDNEIDHKSTSENLAANPIIVSNCSSKINYQD